MDLSAWAGFFSAEVSASATLTGLVTVAISINLTRILETEHLPSRAGELLFSLTGALALCSAALIPGITAHGFGAVALGIAAVAIVFGARNQLLWRRQIGGSEWARQIISATGRVVSTLPIAVGGVEVWFGAPSGLAWIAVGIIGTLVISVLNAWVLLVEIIR